MCLLAFTLWGRCSIGANRGEGLARPGCVQFEGLVAIMTGRSWPLTVILLNSLIGLCVSQVPSVSFQYYQCIIESYQLFNIKHFMLSFVVETTAVLHHSTFIVW